MVKGVLFVFPLFGVIYLFGCSDSHPTLYNESYQESKVEIVSREIWGAKAPSQEILYLPLPISKVIIIHTVTKECENITTCRKLVRAIQENHMEEREFFDIGYNYLVSSDGGIYEGRGWNKQGAHTKLYNNDSIGIALIGNFEIVEPTEEQLNATKELIEKGVQLYKITQDYSLYGHRQLTPTLSPGKFLYDIIKTWPHWTEDI